MKLLEEKMLRPKRVNFIIKENRKSYCTNRSFKDRIFQLLFSEKDAAWELFCALEGERFSEAGDENLLEFVTLQDAIGNQQINDLAFQYDILMLSIVEHQSTWSENMPLRELIYLSRTYEKILNNKKAYERKLYQIPIPHLYVLYNGEEDRPLEVIQRLSDAFEEQENLPWAELMVKVININYNKQHPILLRSKTLREYAFFVEKVRGNIRRQQMNRDEAIQDAVRFCITNDILKEFLEKHGSEVNNMIKLNLTQEEFMEIRLAEMAEDLEAEMKEANKQALEEAKKLVEERANLLAEERVNLLAEEKAAMLAKEREENLIRTIASSGMDPEEIASLTGISKETITLYLAG